MNSNQPKLTRSSSDKVFSGLLGGIAHRYNFEALWLRVGVILGAFMTSGLFVVAYLIVSLIVPVDSDDEAKGHPD